MAIIINGDNTPTAGAIATGDGTTLKFTSAGTAGQILQSNGSSIPTWVNNDVGSVTSVAMSVPTGLTVSGTPITSSGTLAVSLASGYSIPATASQTNWDTAYTDRLKWDGGATGLTAATGRTSLGLGTLATQASSGVAITGGSITGITDLAISDGGTGASDAPTARSNLGLGSAAVLTAGSANGVATLDAGGTVPLSQIPSSIQGGVSYQGSWNASTNTPTLTASVGTKGYYYVVSTSGATNLNGVTDWLVGDWVIYNGSIWQKIDNTDAVASVNGNTGVVVLTASNVGAPSTALTISAGTGLSGGGDLTTNRTISLANTAVTAAAYGSASAVPTFTVNGQGQLTAAASTSIAIANTQVSGLGTMSAQAASGVAITGGSITGITDLAVADGGTGVSTAQAAMNTFAGAITSGSYLRGNGTNVVMSTIQTADVPTLNQNTTGTAANVTGTVAILNGGTGATTAPNARTNLGATTVGGNFFTLTNPTAITFPRINADNTVSALDAPTFRTAIGAGTSSTTGTVTSVGGTGTVSGLTLTGTVTTSGSLTLGGTLSVTNANTTATALNTASAIVARDASGNFVAGTITAALSGNATSATTAGTITSQANSATIAAATANTASTIVLRDASGNFSAGTITAALTGNTTGTHTGAVVGNASTATNVAYSGLTGTVPTWNQNTTGTAAGLSATLAVTSGGTGVTTSTGSGANVLATSPTLVTPLLGTPTSGTLSNCTVDGTNSVGYLNIPQNSQSAAYTAVLSDSGKCIFHPSTDANARTFTIPANASVAYAIGTVLQFVNMTAQVVSIAITTDTMYLAGTGATGTRSLAQYGVANAMKLTSTTWIITGSGLT